MKQSINIAVVILLLTTQQIHALSQCKCTSNTDPFPGSDATPDQKLSISKENEFSGSEDMGKLINVGSITVLQKLAQVQQQSTTSLSHGCPSGYVPVTKVDLETISKREDFKQLTGKDYLNLSTTVVIFSSEKSSPSIIDGRDAKAFEYHTLKLDNNQQKLSIENTYFTKDENRKTLCKRQLSSFSVSLDGYEGYDLEEGKTYEFKITNKNIEKYYIQDNNNKISTTQTFSYTHQGNEWGCATINFKFQVFGGVIAGDCLSIWTRPQFAFNAESSIKTDQIKKVTLSNIKSNVKTKMFFETGTAPIAPIINDSSSLYLYYSEKTTNALKVMKISKEGAQIGNTIDTKEIGFPFDIVSTHFGFVVMANDPNDQAWISAFNKDGTLRWKRILMNNGKNDPTTVTDQIKFHSSNKCELPHGMAVMFNPDNGRLNYARGRIQAIWAHYNYFGMKNGKKDNHTADTMISLDADTGYNQKLFWGWGASHSLYQNLHFDGKYLFVSSLGDAFPMNILFKVCDIEQHECKSKDTLIPGEIPGDGGGKASGRQGGFVDIIGNRDEKFFIYQRKKSDGGYNGKISKNDKNELALIRLDKNLNLINTQILIGGEQASRVNTIKIVRYGKNILVAYSVTPSSEQLENYNRQNIDETVDESYLLLLDGTDGQIISAPTKFDSYQVNASDDWRVLEDGRIVYTYVTKDNSLNFYYTPALIVPQYPNPIKSSDNVYGFKNFVNTNIVPKKNNFNDICIKKGDSNYSIVDFINNDNNDDEGKEDEENKTNSLKLSYILTGLILYLLM